MRGLSEGILLAGILLAILGLVAIILPEAATLAVDIFVGVILVIAAVLLLIYGLATRGRGMLLWIVLAVLAGAVGIMFLAAPGKASVTLTVILAVWFVVGGLVKIVSAFSEHGSQRWLLILNGLISGLLGGLIAASLPDSADWAIGLLVGIMFLVDGLMMIFFSRLLHRAARQAAEAIPPGAKVAA
jgi:uncharacterized membrane protein HdeD (DUF308 family)